MWGVSDSLGKSDLKGRKETERVLATHSWKCAQPSWCRNMHPRCSSRQEKPILINKKGHHRREQNKRRHKNERSKRRQLKWQNWRKNPKLSLNSKKDSSPTSHHVNRNITTCNLLEGWVESIALDLQGVTISQPYCTMFEVQLSHGLRLT